MPQRYYLSHPSKRFPTVAKRENSGHTPSIDRRAVSTWTDWFHRADYVHEHNNKNEQPIILFFAFPWTELNDDVSTGIYGEFSPLCTGVRDVGHGRHRMYGATSQKSKGDHAWDFLPVHSSPVSWLRHCKHVGARCQPWHYSTRGNK